MNHSKYYHHLVATAVCTKIIMVATKWIGQKYIKGATKDCFIFDSWFSSNNSAEDAMEVWENLIGMVKTNTKGFCKDTIENNTKDWTGGSYLVLRNKHMVPRGRLRILLTTGIMCGSFSLLLLQTTQGSHRQVFPIYLISLTSFLMFKFSLLIVPFSCIGSLDLLMSFNPTTNQGSLICIWRSYGLLIVFGYGYV